MGRDVIDIRFPLAGIFRKMGYQSQEPYTTPDCLNVRDLDVFQERLRGGSRPGLAQVLPPKSTEIGDDGDDDVEEFGPIDFSVTKDARLYKLSPNSNYGTNTLNPCGLQTADVTVVQRSVLHFDLTSIAASATLTQADLTLYSPTDYGTGTRTGYVQRLTTTTWISTEVTWNRASVATDWTDGGDTTTTDRATFSMYDAGGALGVVPITINVLALAQDAYTNRSKQLHILLLADDETGATANAQIFYSNDWSGTSQRPKLTVTYTVPA